MGKGLPPVRPTEPEITESELIESEDICQTVEEILQHLKFGEIGQDFKNIGNRLENGCCLRFNGQTYGKEFIDFGDKLIEFVEEINTTANTYMEEVRLEREAEEEALEKYKGALEQYHYELARYNESSAKNEEM